MCWQVFSKAHPHLVILPPDNLPDFLKQAPSAYFKLLNMIRGYNQRLSICDRARSQQQGLLFLVYEKLNLSWPVEGVENTLIQKD